MFEGWSEYFFMLGSSAAALIGLMFVVVTLTAGRDRSELERGMRLYSSPIVWHLAVVLVLSGAAIAPVMGPRLFGTAAGAMGLLGVAIGMRNAIGIARLRISGDENISFDIWWYGLVPAAAYAVLTAGAVGVFKDEGWGAAVTAAGVMALLLVSIHAEWDLVTFLAPTAPTPGDSGQGETPE